MSTINEKDDLSEVDIVESDEESVPSPPDENESLTFDEQGNLVVNEDEGDDDDDDDDTELGEQKETDVMDTDDESKEKEDDDYEIDPETGIIIKEEKEKAPLSLQEFEESDSDDDSDNEKEYNKLETNNYNNLFTDYHPTSIYHNNEEISTLAKIIRDDKNNIIDDLHKTVPFLSKYEKTRVLGQRAKQIENGHQPFVRVADNVIDSYTIALHELEQKKIPFIIRRPLPSGGSEYWNLKDLEII